MPIHWVSSVLRISPSPQGKVQACQHAYPELGHGSVPSSLSSFNSPFKLQALGLQKSQSGFQGLPPPPPLPRSHFWVFAHKTFPFFWRLLPFFTSQLLLILAKPSTEALSSWKPRLEKTLVFYISTAFRNVFQILSILLVLLVSPSPFIWEILVPKT